MPGLNISVGTSVLKREPRDIDEVAEKLKSEGWERTESILGGRVQYFKSAGIGITAMQGPMGTVIMPSGPIRGQIFSGDTVGIGRTSSIGLGEKASDTNIRKKSEIDSSDSHI